MELEIIAKNQYGRVVFHPANPAAKALAAIAGTTTLTPRALVIAKRELGATIKLEVEDRIRAAAELGLDAWNNDGQLPAGVQQ